MMGKGRGWEGAGSWSHRKRKWGCQSQFFAKWSHHHGRKSFYIRQSFSCVRWKKKWVEAQVAGLWSVCLAGNGFLFWKWEKYLPERGCLTITQTKGSNKMNEWITTSLEYLCFENLKRQMKRTDCYLICQFFLDCCWNCHNYCDNYCILDDYASCVSANTWKSLQIFSAHVSLPWTHLFCSIKETQFNFKLPIFPQISISNTISRSTSISSILSLHICL